MNKLLAPRKLSAVLHADAVGFSRLMEADEEQTHRQLSTALRTLITTIEAHSGRVIKTAGDAVLAEFPSVVEAVRAAVSVQRAFADQNRNIPNDQQLAFRIGINLGMSSSMAMIFSATESTSPPDLSRWPTRGYLHLRNSLRSASREDRCWLFLPRRTEGQEHRSGPSAPIASFSVLRPTACAVYSGEHRRWLSVRSALCSAGSRRWPSFLADA